MLIISKKLHFFKYLSLFDNDHYWFSGIYMARYIPVKNMIDI